MGKRTRDRLAQYRASDGIYAPKPKYKPKPRAPKSAQIVDDRALVTELARTRQALDCAFRQLDGVHDVAAVLAIMARRRSGKHAQTASFLNRCLRAVIGRRPNTRTYAKNRGGK